MISNSSRTALVVDDEIFARMFAAQVLEDEGFQTLEAGSTTEALDVLDTNPEVSLLIADVCMPGDKDGLALARKVSRTHPDVAIVIVSGQVRPLFTDIPAGARFLAKPYLAHNLASMIRQAERGI